MLYSKNNNMAYYIPFIALIMALISITKATETPLKNQNILVAIDEMQRANYFTFVMLLNMAPADLIQGNVTFLMPNDRMLATTLMPENAVVDFLLRHSIPSPLLFDHLQHIPTGAMLPTSRPDTMLKVTNNGKRRFFLNNVRVTSPNICTRGSSIRCHGIDGVLQPAVTPPDLSSSTNITNSPRPAPLPSPSAPPALPAPPAETDVNPDPAAAAPPPADSDDSQQKSGSRQTHNAGLFKIIMTTYLMLLVVKLFI